MIQWLMYVNSSRKVDNFYCTWVVTRLYLWVLHKDVYEPRANTTSQTVCIHDNSDVDVLGDDASWFGVSRATTESEGSVGSTRTSSSTHRLRL